MNPAICTVLTACVLLLSVANSSAQEAPKTPADTKCYELRVYFAAEGKLEDLQARFRQHTTKLFEKHGMVNVGYWVPLENKENKLVYLLSYPDRAARDKSWKEFVSDPEWKKVQGESEKNGRLVAKVDSTFLEATDFSPEIKASAGREERVFELRTYTASQGNLARLMARFRNHTTKLFAKHGMTNFGYWKLSKDQKSAEDTLVYLLAHKSKEACMASFDGFRKDPDWTAAKEASEKDAGGSLTIDGGVKSELLKPTDYSPTK